METCIDLSNPIGGGKIFRCSAIDYDALIAKIPTGDTDDLAYVYNSQGVAWLPGTVGGTYYPAGVYIYDGDNWVSDRNAIASQLHNNIDSLALKLDDVVAGSGITIDKSDPQNPIISLT